MKKNLIIQFLEAIAVGDAFGKVTEYCTRQEIKEQLGTVETLLTPQESLTHKDLFYGQITDDTEQNIYLLRQFCLTGTVTAKQTAQALLDWYKETNAAAYIGPSSARAILAIQNGEDISTTGLWGTTCGGIMRAPAAFLCGVTRQDLIDNTIACLLPTHNTAAAMEAAICYVFALEAAFAGKDIDQILDAASEGALLGSSIGNTLRTAGCVPSCAARITYIREMMPHIKTEEKLQELLYDVLGATLASADVCSAVIGTFLWAKDDVFTAIRFATNMGGDSDTIAFLAAGLCCLYAGKHNIPPYITEQVIKANNLELEKLAQDIMKLRKRTELVL
ncbi:MAG: ADP-ribosylglycohydrolase family protein [Sphaerochaetaceae bacterium]|jgi:ADP-ribosylglycohydrolase|nr:ADP-ribosylglycohydrolase family protein [Sphaerochaetaceae bacterium]